MKRLYALALFAVLSMVLTAVMLSRATPGESQTGSDAEVASPEAGQTASQQFYAVEATKLERDRSGQFRLQATANGQDVQFLVDTGADVVALTVETAQDIGIEFNPESFTPIARTASGTGHGTLVTIDRLEVAGAELENVEAMIVDKLDTNLLGQSALRRLGKVELRGDTMTIQHD
jgi:aspartyl protease family protein